MCLIIQLYIRHWSLRHGLYSKRNFKIIEFIKNENSMAWKFLRNHMMVMMDLVILMLVEVQANEVSSTFFHLSSLPISLPPVELDNNHETIYSYLKERFAFCEEKLKKRRGSRALCNMYF